MKAYKFLLPLSALLLASCGDQKVSSEREPYATIEDIRYSFHTEDDKQTTVLEAGNDYFLYLDFYLSTSDNWPEDKISITLNTPFFSLDSVAEAKTADCVIDHSAVTLTYSKDVPEIGTVLLVSPKESFDIDNLDKYIPIFYIQSEAYLKRGNSYDNFRNNIDNHILPVNYYHHLYYSKEKKGIYCEDCTSHGFTIPDDIDTSFLTDDCTVIDSFVPNNLENDFGTLNFICQNIHIFQGDNLVMDVSLNYDIYNFDANSEFTYTGSPFKFLLYNPEGTLLCRYSSKYSDQYYEAVYDDNKNLIRKTEGNYIYNYTYEDNKLVTCKKNSGAVYYYDEFGNVTQYVTDGFTAEYINTYDEKNNLVRQEQHWKNGTMTFTYDNTYDDQGRIISVTEYEDGDFNYEKHYTYLADGTQKLTYYSKGTDVKYTYEYEYDELGNLLSYSDSHSKTKRGSGWVDFTYQNGKISEASGFCGVSFNDSGFEVPELNMLPFYLQSNRTYSYSYDENGILKSVKDAGTEFLVRYYIVRTLKELND